MAMPAAAVTACCSAMPTSKHRSGKRSAKGSRPVESGMAAVMATSSGCLLGLVDQRLGEGGGVAARLGQADVVQALDRVVLGRRVAAALLREHVHDLGPAHLGGVAQGLFERRDVVAVEGAGVADAERLEERGRLPHLADGGLGGLEAPLEAVAQHRHFLEQPFDAGLATHVDGVVADAGQAVAQPTHRRCVRPAVVVEHDDAVAAAVAEVVEALVGHAAGHRTVADHRHDPPMVADARLLGGGQAVGVAQHRRRVAVLDPVVRALGAAGIARQAVGPTQRREVLPATGHDLVHVGLVAGVPQQDVVGRVEHAVQRERQLDDAQVRAEVAAARLVDRVDDELADLDGERLELERGEGSQVVRASGSSRGSLAPRYRVTHRRDQARPRRWPGWAPPGPAATVDPARWRSGRWRTRRPA